MIKGSLDSTIYEFLDGCTEPGQYAVLTPNHYRCRRDIWSWFAEYAWRKGYPSNLHDLSICLPSGAIVRAYSLDEPERLRGRSFVTALCIYCPDEYEILGGLKLKYYSMDEMRRCLSQRPKPKFGLA